MMKNKQELMELGEKIRNSGMKDDKRFKTILNNIATTTTKDLYETVVESCLQYNIDCQELINASADVKESKLSEEEFRKMICMTLL